MGFPRIPSGVRSLVKEKFAAAKECNALTYYPTEVALLKVNGRTFQLRFSQALAHKPKGGHEGEVKDQKPFDPFESPPKELLVINIESSHKVVLNKFAIVPEHFILATTDFKEQTELLEENDLAATFALIRSWKDDGKELFAFFNSGQHSGASQRHRHVQFLPVESMRTGLEGDWSPLVDDLAGNSDTSISFVAFGETLPPDLTPSALHELYLKLYHRACVTVDAKASSTSATSQISYNLGMTDKAIFLCPRRAEGADITIEGHTGYVAFNGTLLAGTLLVKNEMEWNALRADSDQLANILKRIGYPHTTNDVGKL